MRIIGSCENEQNARRLSLYLQKENIENTCEPQMDIPTENFTYQLWIHNEDDIIKGTKIFQEFIKNPEDAKYNVSIKEVLPQVEEVPFEELAKEEAPTAPKPLSYKVTSFLLALCIFFFIVNYYQENAIKKNDPGAKFVLITPVQYYLLFDIPHMAIELQKFITQNKVDMYKKLDDQPEHVKEGLTRIQNMPFWKGFYDVLVIKLKNPKLPWQFSGSFFEKIRQGQVWRIISPCFLHAQFLHILFNMIWLWVLGKQIEQRVNKWKYLLLVLVIGIVSNIFQYLVSGPYFLGYSGVIMGMVGFIWVRQKVAPWEGYPLQKGIFIFLAFYVLAMLGLQIFSFIMEITKGALVAPNIANTAHIVGALTGALLGKLPFFSWRSYER